MTVPHSAPSIIQCFRSSFFRCRLILLMCGVPLTSTLFPERCACDFMQSVAMVRNGASISCRSCMLGPLSEFSLFKCLSPSLSLLALVATVLQARMRVLNCRRLHISTDYCKDNLGIGTWVGPGDQEKFRASTNAVNYTFSYLA